MREYTLEQLKTNRHEIGKINKELLSQRGERTPEQREDGRMPRDMGTAIFQHNWDKLVRQGKIVSLGDREWVMEWDS